MSDDTSKDEALDTLTGDQALTILRRAAEFMENGLDPWDPTGHDSADSLMCTLLGVNEMACRDAAKVQHDDGVDAATEMAWFRGIKVGEEIFDAGRTDQG